MRKLLTAALAALTLGGAVAAAASPASAHPYGWGHHGDYFYRGYYHGHYYVPHHTYGYYAPRYAYGYAPDYSIYSYGPAYCEGGRWVWDPYLGRRVWVRENYPC